MQITSFCFQFRSNLTVASLLFLNLGSESSAQTTMAATATSAALLMSQPPAVQACIAYYLDGRDLVRSYGRVCRSWHRLLTDPVYDLLLWRRVFVDRWGAHRAAHHAAAAAAANTAAVKAAGAKTTTTTTPTTSSSALSSSGGATVTSANRLSGAALVIAAAAAKSGAAAAAIASTSTSASVAVAAEKAPDTAAGGAVAAKSWRDATKAMEQAKLQALSGRAIDWRGLWRGGDDQKDSVYELHITLQAPSPALVARMSTGMTATAKPQAQGSKRWLDAMAGADTETSRKLPGESTEEGEDTTDIALNVSRVADRMTALATIMSTAFASKPDASASSSSSSSSSSAAAASSSSSSSSSAAASSSVLLPLSGRIEWHCTRGATNLPNTQSLVGKRATEHVVGYYLPRLRLVMIQGYRRTGARYVIACDGYALALSSDGHSFVGLTKGWYDKWDDNLIAGVSTTYRAAGDIDATVTALLEAAFPEGKVGESQSQSPSPSPSQSATLTTATADAKSTLSLSLSAASSSASSVAAAAATGNANDAHVNPHADAVSFRGVSVSHVANSEDVRTFQPHDLAQHLWKPTPLFPIRLRVFLEKAFQWVKRNTH